MQREEVMPKHCMGLQAITCSKKKRTVLPGIIDLLDYVNLSEQEEDKMIPNNNNAAVLSKFMSIQIS
jgi:hypothetical protein